MARAPPPGFVDIRTAKSNQGRMSVIGAVVDVMPIKDSGGSSFMITFTLKDSELDKWPFNGLQVRYFNNDREILPNVRLRDILLLRNIKIEQHRGALVGTASQYDRVPWAIFRRDERTPICSTIPVHLTVGERTYANSLFNQTDSIRVQFGSKEAQVTNGDVPSPTMNKPTRLAHFTRFRLIQDIEPKQWVDLTVNVVKTFPERDYFKMEVTDYTTNEALFDYFPECEDERMDGASDGYGHRPRVARRWRRPRGKMTLTIALWEPHGSWTHANISEGDMVFLKNVHIKSFNGFLEAAMHPDRTYPDKINVTKLSNLSNDLQLVDLLRRQQEYYKQFRADQESAKRTVSDALNGGQRTKGKPDDKKGSRGLKKRVERQKRKTIEEDQTEITTALMNTQTRTNNQVRATNPAVPARSIADILLNETHNNSSPDGITYRLPFQNLAYRALVRVVDFFPPQLEDFATPISHEYATSPCSVSDDNQGGQDINLPDISLNQRSVEWEWRFCLLVEDAHRGPRGQSRDRLKLFVHGAEAVFLLGIDAMDLRQNPKALIELKKKLGVLWGNLEELKSEYASPRGIEPFDADNGLKSLPFYCCIHEYGVKKGGTASDSGDGLAGYETDPEAFFGWERRFRIYNTTVHT